MIKVPKVSVIIPVYNVEEYLRECLDSIINQTLKDIEIICVDDGSTDKSLDMLNFYADIDRRIIVCSQENQGAGAARNRGLKIAKGKYIAFMDPDDFYPDDFVLDELYAAAQNNNVEIVGGSLIEVLPDSKCRCDYCLGDGRKFFENGLMNYSEYQYDYYYQRFLYSKKLLQNNNIIFPLYRRHQDVLFFVRAMIASKKFFAMNRSTYCYRVNHKVVHWNKEIAIDVVSAISEVIKLSKENNLDDLHKRVVRRLFIQYAESIFTFAGLEKIRVLLHQAISDVKWELFSEREFKNNIAVLKKANDFHKKLFISRNNMDVEALIDKRECQQPKVSVIVPVYNVEKYLTECLHSIIKQTLQDIEIICVNDGSTDSSLNLLLEIARSDGRIVVLNQQNKGLAEARNIGVTYAKGKYICFVDSDDKLKYESLKELFGKANSENLDVLYFDADTFFENRDIEAAKPEYGSYYIRSDRYINAIEGKKLFVNMVKNGEYRTSACLHFIKREYYLDRKLHFLSGTLHEDNFFAFDCMLKAKYAAHIPEKFYQRRVHENSIMTTKKTFSHAYGYFINVCEMIRTVNDYGLNELEQKYAVEIMDGIIRNIRYIFRDLDESEKRILETLESVEKYIFELLILNSQLSNRQYSKGSGNGIKNKLIKIKECYQSYGMTYTLKKILSRIMRL